MRKNIGHGDSAIGAERLLRVESLAWIPVVAQPAWLKRATWWNSVGAVG